jgi:hypothetical protein
MPSEQQKNRPPQGGRWARLETPGDVRRFLKWLILQTKSDKVDLKKAGVLGQLGINLLKAMGESDLEARIAAIEKALEELDEHLTGNTGLPH